MGCARDSLLELELLARIAGLSPEDLDTDHLVPADDVEAVLPRVDVRFSIEPAHRLNPERCWCRDTQG
jgi:hypothetical protein